MKTINIKINNAKFQIRVISERNKPVYYGITRNDKALLCCHMPSEQRSEFPLKLYKDIIEAISHDIEHEINK